MTGLMYAVCTEDGNGVENTLLALLRAIFYLWVRFAPPREAVEPFAMNPQKQSRRAFLTTSGSVIGGSWFALNLPVLLATADLACQAHAENAPFDVLTPAEAVELEAIAAQIIPSDETPGAREAGVIYFIDRALGSIMADDLDAVRDGLRDFETDLRDSHPAADAFSTLANDQQVEALRAIEESDFFETIRTLTIAGMFAHPSYGGNRNKAGWTLLRFDDRPAWTPPFGYYDAQYAQGNDGQ